MRRFPPLALLLTFTLLLVGSATAEQAKQAKSADADGFSTFISPAELVQLRHDQPDVIVLDARSPEEYAKGHIPGAINLPGADLRTPKAKPGEGHSQYVFRTEDGRPDIARYEAILGKAGIRRDDTVVIYGNHAGKTDGSVPAMLLDWLGQKQVYFLDGVGMSEWYKAGYQHETKPHTRPATEYHADPQKGFVWNLDDVLSHIGSADVIFYDTRSPEEYVGENLRDNRFGGHIPGAILCEYSEFLTPDKTLKGREEVKSILQQHKLDQDSAEGKTVVLYCQTATRVSLPYLVLRELGYDDVVIYDASWFEYGNLANTPKVTGEQPEEVAAR